MAGLTYCGFAGCKYSLYGQPAHDVPGRRHEGFDDRGRARLLPELWDPTRGSWPPSCALDVADRGEHSSGQVARYAHVSKRRVEQIVKRARVLAKERNPDEEIEEPTGYGTPLAEAQIRAL